MPSTNQLTWYRPGLEQQEDEEAGSDGGLRTRLRAVVQQADVIIGLHPDEATEPLVDAAIRYGKPFALVPCCVFPTLFPHRFLPLSPPLDEVLGTDKSEPKQRPVRSHADFLQYLQLKSDAIQVGFLPFQGKNKLLFSPGD